jgi:hypothetical protein
LEHAAYSPDLAPSNYHLFPALKDHFGGNKFQSDNDVKTAVIQQLQLQGTDFAQQENERKFCNMANASLMVGTTLKSKVSVIKLHVYCFG